MRATRLGHGYVVTSPDITKRIQAEQALHETEALFRAFFESPGEMRSIVEIADGQITHLTNNTEAAAFYAATWKPASGQPIVVAEAFSHVGQLYLDAYEESRRTGQRVQFEYNHPTAPSARRLHATVSYLGTPPNGRPRYASSVTDITNRTRDQAALLESEAHLAAAQRTAHVGSWNTDLATGHVRWSDEMYRIFGVERSEFAGTTEGFLSLVHPDDRTRVVLRDQAAAQAGDPYSLEFRIVRPDGALRIVEERIEIIKDSSRRPIEFVGTLQDITERVTAEGERARLVSALEQSGDAVVIGQIDGPTEYVNASFERLYGYDRGEVLGHNLNILKSGRHTRDFWQDVWNRIRAGETWSGPLVNRRIDGTTVEVEAVLSGFQDAQGQPTGFIATHRDITHERALENQLRQATKMEAIGQLAGGVAHDFNNMLTAIRGYTELLRFELPPEHEQAQADLEQVILAADRASELTRQLLAFARRQVLAPRLLDPAQVVAGIAPLLQRLLGAHLELTVHAAAGIGAIRVDPAQLEQVIVNLVLNARDAMPEGGRLAIEISNVELDPGYVATHLGATVGPHVEIAVSDTGAGIDPETMPRLFEPFFTTKTQGKGTGMGLATVYGIVQQSAGSIYVSSDPGHGTTFRINFPRVIDEALPAAPAAPPDVAVPVGTETVLLAEDEATVRGFTRRALANLGYTVLEAGSGTEALAVAEAHRGPIELLVTDVLMPGMQGAELAARLTALRPGLRTLYVSGFTETSPIDQGVRGAAIAYLPKPFTAEKLGVAVRAVLDGADSA